MNTARWIVVGFGVIVASLGATFVAWPATLVDFAEQFVSTRGLWIAVAVRLTLGILLWITASASRTPTVLRALGVLFVLSAVVLPFLGLQRLEGIVDWGSNLDGLVLRTVGLVATVVGAFLVWSVSPRRSEKWSVTDNGLA